MERKLNRITLRNGECATEELVSRLISEAEIEPEDVGFFTSTANLLSQMVREDDDGRVDLFIQNQAGESFLCINIQTVYFAVKAKNNSLQSLMTIIDEAYSMTCRSVNEELMIIQLKFDL